MWTKTTPNNSLRPPVRDSLSVPGLPPLHPLTTVAGFSASLWLHGVLSCTHLCRRDTYADSRPWLMWIGPPWIRGAVSLLHTDLTSFAYLSRSAELDHAVTLSLTFWRAFAVICTMTEPVCVPSTMQFWPFDGSCFIWSAMCLIVILSCIFRMTVMVTIVSCTC